jgi:hypothetical protein
MRTIMDIRSVSHLEASEYETCLESRIIWWRPVIYSWPCLDGALRNVEGARKEARSSSGEDADVVLTGIVRADRLCHKDPTPSNLRVKRPSDFVDGDRDGAWMRI